MEKKRFQKIYIEILNTCNLNCAFCMSGKRAPKVMSVEKFTQAILKIKDYTNLIALHVKGEPLMHPYLKEILEICTENNMQVNITTNATLLLECVDFLKTSKSLRQLNLSLHSMSQNQDSNYTTKKYMENIFKACKILKESNNPYISYRLWNLQSLQKNEENLEIIKLLECEYNVNNLIEKAKENFFIELSEKVFLNQDLEFTWPSLESNEISETGTCWGLRNQLAILANGDVVPCCLDQNGDIKLGNIFEQNLNEIISSDYSQAIIKGFESNKLIHDLCKTCGFIEKFNK